MRAACVETKEKSRPADARHKVSGVRSEGGFTLIEIMIALAILGGSMFLLLDAHYRAMRLHDSVVEEMLATDLMVSALGQAELETLAQAKGKEGDFGKRYPDYTYTYDAEVDSENDPGFWTVTVTLNGPNGEQQQMKMMFYDILRGQTPAAGGLQGQFGQQGLGATTRNTRSGGKTQ